MLQLYSVCHPLLSSFRSSDIFIVSVIVAPFLRPANKVGDTPPLPYYLYVAPERQPNTYNLFINLLTYDNYRYCLVGIAIMLVGVLYWAAWRVLLPKIFGYTLVPKKQVLEDGTVVNVVRISSGLRLERVLSVLTHC